MKKLKSKSGLTLMEMMAALLVMVLLVVGMGTGMDSGMRVYRESKFETDSAALADILNTSMSDLLRYAQDIKSTTVTPDGVDFVFTNHDFGVLNGYLLLSEDKTFQIKNEKDERPIDLINSGAYSDDLYIKIRDIEYISQDESGTTVPSPDGTGNPIQISRGGFFYIVYDIKSKIDTEKTREVITVVRQMNAQ